MNKRKKELEENPEKYGKQINPEVVREKVEEMLFNNIQKKDFNLFLNVFNDYIDLETKIAIKYEDGPLASNVQSYHLIAKNKDDENIEVSLNTTWISYPHLDKIEFYLKIGLEYKGNDINFQAKVPKKKNPTHHDNFSLLLKKHTARIMAYKEYFNGEIQKKEFVAQVEDKKLEKLTTVEAERLEKLAIEIYQKIETLRSENINNAR